MMVYKVGVCVSVCKDACTCSDTISRKKADLECDRHFARKYIMITGPCNVHPVTPHF